MAARKKAPAKKAPAKKAASRKRSPRKVGEKSTAPRRRLDTIRAVQLAMAGLSVDAIAAQLQVSHDTIHRYLTSPEGLREVGIAEAELRSRGSRMLATLHLQAYRTLAQAMNEAPRWADRIAAAGKVTEMYRRFELTGADGGSIEVDVTAHQQLDDRVAEIATRLAGQTIIDADGTVVEVVSPPEDLDEIESGDAGLRAVE